MIEPFGFPKAGGAENFEIANKYVESRRVLLITLAIVYLRG